MMRCIMSLVFLLLLSLEANDYTEFARYYKQQDFESYKQACQIGQQIFAKGERDEKLLSLIGMACLRADYIDTLGSIQSRLYQTEEGRANASLFASMILQKRLIAQSFYDDSDISSLALPITDHPLSIVFAALRDKQYELLKENPRLIRFKKDGKEYRVYVDFEKKDKIAIDIFFDDGTLQQHRYR